VDGAQPVLHTTTSDHWLTIPCCLFQYPQREPVGCSGWE